MPSVTATIIDPRPPRIAPPALLERRWQPGQSGNPGGRTKLEAEVRKCAQQRSERAIERCGEILESKDERAALVAAQTILDRAWGKPKEAKDSDGRPALDLSKLDPAELRVLGAMLGKLLGVGGDGPPVASGEATVAEPASDGGIIPADIVDDPAP